MTDRLTHRDRKGRDKQTQTMGVKELFKWLYVSGVEWSGVEWSGVEWVKIWTANTFFVGNQTRK